MNQSFFTNLFPASGYRSRLLSYPVICLLAILMPAVHTQIFPFYLENWDIPSYLNAKCFLLDGTIDLARTPGYPHFLRLMQALFQSHFKLAVVLVQYVCFLCTIPLFSKVGSRIIQSPRITFWLTAFYALCPGIGQYYHILIPESFTISLSVVLLSCLVLSRQQTFTMKRCLASLDVLLLLISLKPVFLYLLPAFAAYLLLLYTARKIQGRRVIIAAVGGIALLCGITCLYLYKMNQRYGIHTVTDVTLCNDYMLVRELSWPNPAYATTPRAKACFTKLQFDSPWDFDISTCWHEIYYIQQHLSPAEFEAYVNNAYRATAGRHTVIYANRLLQPDTALPVLHRMLHFGQGDYSGLSRYVSAIETRLTPSLLQCYLFCIIFFIASLRMWYTGRKVPANSLLLFMISFGIITVSILGAFNSYTRLCVSGSPALLLMIGSTFNLFKRNSRCLE